MRELFDVVHQGEQLPLRFHLGLATQREALEPLVNKPTCRVLDSFMVRLLVNSQRPERPPVRCMGVARHVPGAQPAVSRGTDRRRSRSHFV
jgi:hypothetical protein